MTLIAGLGNPGRRYERTRHNAGFMVIDKLAGTFDLAMRAGKGDFEYAEHALNEERLLLVKPTTFMNNSGTAVREIAQFYKIHPRHILVVCDDAALPLGRIRLREKGSDGGQNGLKSVIYHLNTDEFPRLRVGIGSEMMSKMALHDFVLSRFTEEEDTRLSKAIELAHNAAMEFVNSGIDRAMNLFNGVTVD